MFVLRVALIILQAGTQNAPSHGVGGLVSALATGSLQTDRIGVLGTVKIVDVQRLRIHHLLDTGGASHDDDDDAFRNE